MNTYRTACNGRGAFELCLPSLGFFFTKLTLRSLLVGQASHMAPSWVTVGHRGSRSERHVESQHYALGSVGLRLLLLECVPEVLGIGQ